MAKPDETKAPEVGAPAQVMQMNASDFQAILAAAISSATQASSTQAAQMLKDAMIELKKPYVDPNQEQMDEMWREQARKIKERSDKSIKESQSLCPHFQGSSEHSEIQGQMSSIVRHRLDDQTIIGICTNCQRLFKPGDPDYVQEIRRKSGNKLSSAGLRTIVG